ncbi:protein dj-1beta [Lingula anatina]|uniref:Protein dj-1beta n=1 Tax=Lingula anatina TaxID=7574 RepID=A0A1S3JP47_LINAN|nr:protein dj-1beta [Lingula anatina]|eukprot:XP_013411911.1 protein dj-1beta [Lingula anatina]
MVLHVLRRNLLRIPLLVNRNYCSVAKMPSALLLVAEGSEEMEAVISIDVMRRGGIDVTVAGVTGTDPVKCSRGVVVVPDKSLDEATKDTYDMVVLPGGLGGANTFSQSNKVKEVLQAQEASGKWIAAICAAPIALVSHGICKGKTMTSHPSVKDKMLPGCTYSEERVVKDGKLLTSRGPGTAFEFALDIVQELMGKEKRDVIVPPMLVKA